MAFTYNDPVIFAEYAMDTADACHALGVQTVAVTAGYMHAEPRRDFFAKMDAANVDLKGFTDAFYFQQTGAHLAPVLDTLQHIVHETDCWLEITTLLIPGHNDSNAELEAMTRWVAEHLGRDVPLHFTAFHPDYKMTDVAGDAAGHAAARARASRWPRACTTSTPATCTTREGGTTFCPGCEQAADRARLARGCSATSSTRRAPARTAARRSPGASAAPRRRLRPRATSRCGWR